ncbi:MAG TPA: type 4 pilus major pilin [Gammaproteobacteria bacterium]|nr:type 4 pilus major pilin [Gammaproteobacteria bacterium]
MMKRPPQSILGVTLLEIMLVLAIAAMVIVMSIRYYQSASLNQKIAATLNNITAIVAAGESYLAATGDMTAVSSTTLNPYLPGNTMPYSGWGGQMSVTGGSANSYSISIPSVPTGACTQLTNLVKQNSKLSIDSGCASVTVTE